MCIVCVEWEKGKLTNQEALSALGEMIVCAEGSEEKVAHYFDVSDKILDKEEPPEEDELAFYAQDDDE